MALRVEMAEERLLPGRKRGKSVGKTQRGWRRDGKGMRRDEAAKRRCGKTVDGNGMKRK